MNRQGRGREGERRGRAGVVASSAFQNMRPYFTDIYCYRNVFFFLAEATYALGGTVVYVYGSSTR